MRFLHSFKSLALLLFISMVMSCSGDSGPGEEKVMEREQFVKLLADVQIVESMHQTMISTDMEFDIETAYAWLFKEYNVTEQEFESSIAYYSQSAKTYEEIYDEVIIIISEKEVEFTQKLKESISENQPQSASQSAPQE